jgi:histidinol-phosphate aminotransferase
VGLLPGRYWAGPLNTVRGLGNVNSAAQAAGVVALTDKDFLSDIRVRNRADLDRLTHELQSLGLEIVPSAGNFVLIRFSGTLRKAAKATNDRLLSEGIILRHVPDHGLPDYIRMTLGTPAECGRVIGSLKQFLDK